MFRPNQAKLADAIFPDRYRVAGVWLRPFTLGHLFLLTRLGHPSVIAGHRRLDPAWLALGVVVCAFPWWLSSVLVNSFAGRTLLRVVALLVGRSPRAVGQWWAYVVGNIRGPESWQKGNEGGVKAPFFGVITETLMSRHGFSWREALGCPVSRARWLCGIAWDVSGVLEMESDADAEAKIAAENLGRTEAVNGEREVSHGGR